MIQMKIVTEQLKIKKKFYQNKENLNKNIDNIESNSKLWYQDWSLKGTLVNQGRCPKCTLKIPCKHYKNEEELKADNNAVPQHRK